MLAQSVAEILTDHVTLTVESLDRVYLNVYMPKLQYPYGAVKFFRDHRGQPLASSALMRPMSERFVAALERFIASNHIPVECFAKGERKDDVMARRLRDFQLPEGVVFVGKAQEKAKVLRTEKRHNAATGSPYPWIVMSTAMVNHYYIYAVDRDFGPFFIKFCSYFPYNARLCLNGHEYAKPNSNARASPSPRSTMACWTVPIRSDCKRSATACRPTKSTPCCASGCGFYPIRSPPATGGPVTDMTSRSCRPSSPRRKCSTGRRVGECSSSR